MRQLVLFAIALFVCACAPVAGPTAPPAAQERPALLLGPDTRTLLVGDAALSLTHQCSRISPGPVERPWSPTTAQLDAADNALAAYLAGRLHDIQSASSPGDYYRQYAAFEIGGRRVLYINGVHTSTIERQSDPARAFDWRTAAVQICDGGSITFGVEYDVTTRQFANFAFNGHL
jgi:hypothetical protein